MSGAAGTQSTYINLGSGDPAPWFRQRTSGGEHIFLDKMAGRYVVLCFFLSASDQVGTGALEAAEARRALFDDRKVSFFGVSADQSDESSGRLREYLPGFRHFLDFDANICRAYGGVPRETAPGKAPVRRFWLVLDPMLRVLKVLPFAQDGSDRIEIFRFIESLPPVELFAGVELQAPVLFLPRIFEPEFCRRLVALYQEHGGTESGFMRERDGKTVLVTDPLHKRRKDYNIEDEALIEEAKRRIARRIVPEIAKAYQFQVTRIERFIVACYSADDGGHFNAHRDNTTKGTAHRRFAVSLNLNDDYDGGEIRFPEFGPKGFRPPPGAAVVFSCSLLHAANRVTRGERYVFLPFLYDEAASAIREQNNRFLDPAVGQYRA
jgi:peroxiredoxin/predicted 2-oxoglutarate/Fe(II)-dependent dioxygenase YbiX